jgi:hypothetical protein
MSANEAPRLPRPLEVRELAGHLFIHHSYYIPDSDNDLGELTAFHEEEHDGWLPITHPHTHTAPPAQEEWSWD